ncbi:TIGR03087 family PEP-CTERM/XrtA system glycosyltransferase [Sphingomonas morindae]|uniref:TIGR03087 family PEP-CTERM/XrtA system glycosyltransferase n=1 Tax=Sphingomonas morindae TaxID=1541170 RepID=A0ABY4X5H2_9SPHN|nr:TIGR03087 family PEP-CTERM/XrtA system glycosyltransferase [Sphingomonas morindae]USI72126.1 TIGR03087 family PEP-CTERM/XrtA system glycosyltransferase [Sphingomonas morindae]
MADLLFLAHRIPFPPDRGDKIRSYHILRHLAARHRVHLGAFADDEADLAHAEALRPLVHRLHVEIHRRGKGASLLRSLITRTPASVAALASRTMGQFVDDVLATEPVGRIYVFSGQMAQFAPEDRPFIMDFVDIDSEKFADYARTATGPVAGLWAREARRLAAFEREMAGRAVVSLFVSEAEAALFRSRTRLPAESVQVLENGIDLERYAPAPYPEPGPPLILFTGQMDYPPNIEAATGFARNALPLIRARHPEARFAIVGRRPDPGLYRLGEGVEVTGEVPDTRPWLARAHVVVAPLRLARGVQNKVLEGMAMARPVVASPQAHQGIDAAPGRDLLVAEGWSAEAQAVSGLLDDPARAAAIGLAARRQIEARYGWDARLAPLDEMLTHI